MTRYIKVQEQGTPGDETIEIPLEDDNSLPLADVVSQFPAAVGLKAKVSENSTRAVKIRENVLYPLEASEDEETVFIVVVQGKRSRDDDTEDTSRAKTSKMPQLEVIVLGLPFEEKEESLKEYFSKYGEVADVDIKKNYNGKSRGFCFVKFKEEEGVKAAAADSHTIGGRECTVKVPYKRDERPGGQNDGQLITKLFIGKLPESVTDVQLRKIFGEFGELKDVYIPQRPFRGIAYVEFVEREAMEKSLAVAHTVDGVELNVSEATPRNYNPSGPPGGGYGGGGYHPGGRGPPGGGYGGGYGGNGGYGGPPSGGSGWGGRGGGQGGQWSQGGYGGGYGGGYHQQQPQGRYEDYNYQAGGHQQRGGWNGQGGY